MSEPRNTFSPDDDAAWAACRAQWKLRPGTIYLNHGSFGPPPEPVREARQRWQEQLDTQPMDFFFRQYEPAWFAARERLARFVNTDAKNLVFQENATAAMNVVAMSLAATLRPDDEVLLTDHEYGAVQRTWERACRLAGKSEPRVVVLPQPFESAEQVVDAILAAATERTKLLVVSHITSPTATILPVHAICRAARARNVSVCIDGPHALVQTDVDLAALDCDFYAASCHKWLSAPCGSGFLYVHPRRQAITRPVVQSWGRINSKPQSWDDEFVWSGTRDPSPYLAIPAAIEFAEAIGVDRIQARQHSLARYARQRLVELTRLEPLMPDSPAWYGSMAHVPLPPGEAPPLQRALWERFGIEAPIIQRGERRYIRVSCHLYNTRQEIDRLVDALSQLV